MLEIVTEEIYDETTSMILPGKVYHFEHSLLAISQWEMVFKKPFPFLNGLQVEPIEVLAYVQLMNLDKTGFDIDNLSESSIKEIIEYINSKPTATTISSSGEGGRRILTSEVIYAYMANAQVPYSCETWNIHRLLVLLGVIGELNAPKKKRSKEETARMYKDLNAKRRAEMGTTG